MAELLKADLECENEKLKIELTESQNELDKLKKEVEQLKEDNRQLISGVYWSLPVNERNAGRKPKINDKLIKKVTYLRTSQKLTIKSISERLNISVGLVHKILKNY